MDVGLIRRGSNGITLDLAADILSRLPARSVIRFRCVCKLWQSLTHDSYFIDTHLQRAPNSILIFVPNYKRGRYRTESHHRIKVLHSRGPLKRFLTRRNPKNSNPNLVSLKSSCNGLLCIEFDKGVELFNPATRESLTPPTPTQSNPDDKANSFDTFNLGFCSATKEYKLVHFFAKCKEVMGCEVYTLGTTSWRQSCDLHYSLVFWERGAAVKGAIYWRVYSSASKK